MCRLQQAVSYHVPLQRLSSSQVSHSATVCQGCCAVCHVRTPVRVQGWRAPRACNCSGLHVLPVFGMRKTIQTRAVAFTADTAPERASLTTVHSTRQHAKLLAPTRPKAPAPAKQLPRLQAAVQVTQALVHRRRPQAALQLALDLVHQCRRRQSRVQDPWTQRAWL